VDLHAEGWSNTTISAYLQTPRPRVYEVLKRWAEEGHAGLDDRPSSAPHNPARKVTINAINEVGKLARESPELGAFRVRAALEQIGIHLSQATCGRLLSLNRDLYGLASPKETAPLRSPQLTLFDVGPGEWVLYWRTPDYAPRVRKRRIEGLVQPPLFDLQPVEKVVGGNDISVAPSPHSHLYLAPRRSETQGTEE
jgi:Homeodomain-like domain